MPCSGMFRNVPGCSGMFRDVPECSMFQVLSTPSHNNLRLLRKKFCDVCHVIKTLPPIQVYRGFRHILKTSYKETSYTTRSTLSLALDVLLRNEDV